MPNTLNTRTSRLARPTPVALDAWPRFDAEQATVAEQRKRKSASGGERRAAYLKTSRDANTLLFPSLNPVGRFTRRRPGGSFAPRMAAMRLEETPAEQLPLSFLPKGPQILVHEGARRALERRFSQAFGRPVRLAVTDNRRRMVTHCVHDKVLEVRVHMMFLGAPSSVLDALVEYVVHGDTDASQLIGKFIDVNAHRIRPERSATGPLRTTGNVHDLSRILTSVCEEYIGTDCEVAITWGRRAGPRGGKSRHAIKLGSYSALERLIRIHPVLDKEWVPRYFVAYIVYHELLHHLIPAQRVGGRTLLHPAEFSARESEFRHYGRALAWERKHIDRLLRSG